MTDGPKRLVFTSENRKRCKMRPCRCAGHNKAIAVDPIAIGMSNQMTQTIIHVVNLGGKTGMLRKAITDAYERETMF